MAEAEHVRVNGEIVRVAFGGTFKPTGYFPESKKYVSQRRQRWNIVDIDYYLDTENNDIYVYHDIGKRFLVRSNYYDIRGTFKGSYTYDEGSGWIGDPDISLEDIVSELCSGEDRCRTMGLI